MTTNNHSVQSKAEETGEQNSSGFSHTFRALRHRNYQLFFIGQLISLSGTWMQSVAQSWLVYKLTGSAALLGLIGFAGQIPVFLLATFGGTIADRYNRHRILIITQSVAMILATLLAALALTGYIQIWHLFAIAVGLGIVNAFDIPTRQAFVPDMVGKEDLINAIALNSSMFNGARIVGPAIAGLLVASVGEAWCFFINAVSFIAVIIGLLLMKVEVKEHAQKDESVLSGIIEGFSYVAKTAPIRALMLLLGLISLVGMPYAVLMPIFAEEILKGGPSGLGLLMGASGVGALAAALTLASRKGIRGLGRWVAISSASFGIFIILFSFSRSFWLSAAILIPVGFSMMTQMSSSNTLIQSLVPDNLRGRVMAVYSMMFMGMAPFGALLAGSLAERLGAPTTVAIGGAVCILGSILFSLRLPALKAEARRIVVALQMTGGDPANEVTISKDTVLTSKNT